MTEREKSIKIGLLVRLYNNLGNQATFLATIQNLQDRLPNAEFLALNEDPDKARQKYNIESFPIRYKDQSQAKQVSLKDETYTSKNVKIQPSSLFQVLKNLVSRQIKGLMTVKTKRRVKDFFHLPGNLRNEVILIRNAKERLKSVDVMMICGTGPLQDILGPWNYPYTIFKWVLLAEKTDTKVFFVSVGAGPPTHYLSNWFYKKALTRADYLSFRSSWSKEVIENRISDINGLVYPDLVHSLKISSHKFYCQQNQRIVAINPMRVFMSCAMKKGERSQYDYYLDKVIEFIVYTLSKGFSVRLFNSSGTDLNAINEVIERLKLDSNVNMDKVTVVHNKTVQNLIDNISDVDVIVATRFHSTITPIILGKPVIALAYHQKSKEMMEKMNLGDYCLNVYNFTAEELSTTFDLLLENIKDVKKNIERYQKKNEKVLDEQWDHLVDLIKR